MKDSSTDTSFSLERGTLTTISPNRPLKFRIAFIHGTTVEGVILPNSGFMVCDNGDITEFSLTVDDDTAKRPELIELKTAAPSSQDGHSHEA